MPTRSVTLSEDETEIVDNLVESGRFRDAGEAVREGLRLVAEVEDETFGYTLEELKAAVQIGLDDLDNGRYIEFESVEGLVAHLKRFGDDIISGKLDR